MMATEKFDKGGTSCGSDTGKHIKLDLGAKRIEGVKGLYGTRNVDNISPRVKGLTPLKLVTSK